MLILLKIRYFKTKELRRHQTSGRPDKIDLLKRELTSLHCGVLNLDLEQALSLGIYVTLSNISGSTEFVSLPIAPKFCINTPSTFLLLENAEVFYVP